MASASNKKNKSSGMRILWIPGGRKSHPKGRFSSTNKHISYSPTQKKSEVWSLGGTKTQRELLEPGSPEISGAASTSTLAALGTMSCTLEQNAEKIPQNADGTAIEKTDEDSECATMPTTPSTATATTPQLVSPFVEQVGQKNMMTPALLVTTVEILDLHNNTLNPTSLPKVPSHSETDLSTSAVVLNSSAGTTASIETASSPVTNRKNGTQVNSLNASPQKSRYKNHNNNHEDINSIESISSYQNNPIHDDFEWIDEMVQQRNCKELMHKNKRKKGKKSLEKLESDQLDGKMFEYNDAKKKSLEDDDDDKVVKCLYYSLMCCDCTIS